MITDEQIREIEWQNGIYQLKKGCQDLLDEIERAENEKDITRLKALHFHGQTQFSNCLTDRILYFNGNDNWCESSIERLFLETFDAIRTKDKDTMYDYWLDPQVEIGNYRVDFELINHKDKKIIVECDGHEFHQKSKQQVEKDNQRERDLKKLGYEVVRFSGSEIFKDAEKCVEDLLDILNR